MASKSLFGATQELNSRKIEDNFNNKFFVKKKAIILEVLSNYKDFSDLSDEARKFIDSKLGLNDNFSFTVLSGLHFFVLIEDGTYDFIPCPISEDEVRFYYGSDDNIIGRMLESEVLNGENKSFNGRRVRFLNNESDYLQDNDRYIPLSIGSLFGSNTSSIVKQERFKVNLKSGKGVFNG